MGLEVFFPSSGNNQYMNGKLFWSYLMCGELWESMNAPQRNNLYFLQEILEQHLVKRQGLNDALSHDLMLKLLLHAEMYIFIRNVNSAMHHCH